MNFGAKPIVLQDFKLEREQFTDRSYDFGDYFDYDISDDVGHHLEDRNISDDLGHGYRGRDITDDFGRGGGMSR